MDNNEAWKRAQFAEHLHWLKSLIDSYEDYTLSPEKLIEGVGIWHRSQRPKAKNHNPQLEETLRNEWSRSEDIETLRKYSDLGLTHRDMGRVIGVNYSTITRWLNGTRTKRT